MAIMRHFASLDEALESFPGLDPIEPKERALVKGWLERGDGVAVYENHDLGHPEVGYRKFVSYGSSEAQLETDEPPQTLPDIGGTINWRYQLIGVYRPEKT